MSEAPRIAAGSTPDGPVSLKAFFAAAVLWLPLAFFFWFLLSSAVIYPAVRLTAWVFSLWMPGLITEVHQEYHEMLFSVIAAVGNVGNLPADRILVDLTINVLPYCYGIPVLMGLSIATPISWARTFRQLALGLPILILGQAFGVIGEVLKKLAFEIGPAAHAALTAQGYPVEAGPASIAAALSVATALAAAGIGRELIALWYQFGYLVLPAISPVVIWILLNRDFVEAIRRGVEEPVPHDRGQTGAP